MTAETVANLSFQAPPPKSPRADPPNAGGSFEALLDSTTADNDRDDRATFNAQPPSVTNQQSARRSDATSAAESRSTRDGNASDQPDRSGRDDRDPTAQQTSGANSGGDSNAGAKTDAKAEAKIAATQRSRAKSSNGEDEESTGISDQAAANSLVDSASPAQQDQQATTLPAIAAVIPVAPALTDAPTTPAGSGNATAPLAIAAAAIAASSSAGTAPAAASSQLEIQSEVASAAIGEATTATPIPDAITPDAVATAKTFAEAGGAGSTVAKQPTTQPDAVTTATATAAAALASNPAPLKAPVAAQAKAAASDDAAVPPTTPAEATSSAELLPNQVAQPAAPEVRREGDNSSGNTIKADASASPSPAAGTVHEHSAAQAAADPPLNPSNAGVPAASTTQPQFSAATTTAYAAPSNVTAPSSPAVPLSGLALEIAVSARSGKSRFEIRLDPADLGRIDVRIDVDRNGQITSHLTVEKPETLSMLRQEAPQLQRQLDDAGFKTGDGGLQFSLRDQSSSGQNNGDDSGRNGQRLIISDDEPIQAAVAGRSYGRALGSSSGVDIRV